MKKNMLAVFILALTLANLAVSAITLMVVTPNLKNTNDFITKVAAAIELEELENKGKVGLDEMENYVLTKSSENIVIYLKSDGDSNSYAVIKGISLTLNTRAADYSKVKGLIEKNTLRIQDLISTTYEGYTKDEAKNRKSQLKNEILDKLEKMFESDTIIDISFGSITYQ